MKWILLLCIAYLPATAQTPRIVFKVKNVYPEGVAFNAATNLFFVSSVRTGTIATVDMNGNYKTFYEDSTLKSSFGLKIDHNILWVCTGDPNYSQYQEPATYKKIGRLIGLDIKSGKKVKDIDLAKLYSGEHFINDFTLDDQGNLYLTDSYSPVIYKVDAKGTATVFTKSDLFKSVEVGLNGIVYKNGYLLADVSSAGALYKIDLKNPQNITPVKIKNFFPGADGLLWDDKGNLVLIQNKGVDKIFQLSSTDDWATAELKAATALEDRFQYPSTGILAKGNIYVVNAKLNELADPTKRPSKEFSLQQVIFKPLK
jgi:DNA-binding beta-propeller fold protein YncE